jgi:hypothetical protein
LYSFLINVKPSPNSSKNDGISSSINSCNNFSDILSASILCLFLIIIGFLTKSLTSVLSLTINLFLVDSGNLSYSLDFILALSSFLLKFCDKHILT